MILLTLRPFFFSLSHLGADILEIALLSSSMLCPDTERPTEASKHFGESRISIGGPPDSGKSVFVRSLTRSIYELSGGSITPTVVAFHPDSEHSAFDQDLRGNEALAVSFRALAKGSHGAKFAEEVGLPRLRKAEGDVILADFGGKLSDENRTALEEEITHIILVGRSEEELQPWIEAAKENNVTILAKFISDLDASEDDVRDFDIDGSLVGVLHDLSKGSAPDKVRSGVTLAAELAIEATQFAAPKLHTERDVVRVHESHAFTHITYQPTEYLFDNPPPVDQVVAQIAAELPETDKPILFRGPLTVELGAAIGAFLADRAPLVALFEHDTGSYHVVSRRGFSGVFPGDSIDALGDIRRGPREGRRDCFVTKLEERDDQTTDLFISAASDRPTAQLIFDAWRQVGELIPQLDQTETLRLRGFAGPSAPLIAASLAAETDFGLTTEILVPGAGDSGGFVTVRTKDPNRAVGELQAFAEDPYESLPPAMRELVNNPRDLERFGPAKMRRELGETLSDLSRTVGKGVHDQSSRTGTTDSEEPVQNLREQAERNVDAAYRFIMGYTLEDLRNPADVKILFEGLVIRLTEGLPQDDDPVYRTWDTKPEYGQVSKVWVTDEAERFYQEFARRVATEEYESRELTTWLEHELNGRIHAFRTCMRTTVIASFLVSSLMGESKPDYPERERYTAGLGESLERFSEIRNSEN